MKERSKRRKMSNDIMTLNKNGWFSRNGVTFLASNYIRVKISEKLNLENELRAFLKLVSSSKIIASNKTDRDNLIELLRNHKLNPTINKFVLLKDD